MVSPRFIVLRHAWTRAGQRPNYCGASASLSRSFTISAPRKKLHYRSQPCNTNTRSSKTLFVKFLDNMIGRSEEHTSELQSLMRISYAVFCLKKKKKNTHKQ